MKKVDIKKIRDMSNKRWSYRRVTLEIKNVGDEILCAKKKNALRFRPHEEAGNIASQLTQNLANLLPDQSVIITLKIPNDVEKGSLRCGVVLEGVSWYDDRIIL